MVFGDQPQRLLLADLRIALVVGLVELDLGAAEIGQAGGGAERQVLQFRMSGIDDLGGERDGVFRRLAGARGIAGQRIDRADLHGVGGARRDGRNRATDCGHCRGKQKPAFEPALAHVRSPSIRLP